MRSFRRLKRVALIAGLAGCVFAQPVVAQTYPTGNVNVIVAFAAGGIADAIGRLVAQKLSDSLKQSFVVENRGGAGGVVGAELVANAPKDGHTLLVVSLAITVNPWL